MNIDCGEKTVAQREKEGRGYTEDGSGQEKKKSRGRIQ